MKTKKAYSLALAAVMASSVLWGCGSSSTDPGRLKLQTAGQRRPGEGRPCG